MPLYSISFLYISLLYILYHSSIFYIFTLYSISLLYILYHSSIFYIFTLYSISLLYILYHYSIFYIITLYSIYLLYILYLYSIFYIFTLYSISFLSVTSSSPLRCGLCQRGLRPGRAVLPLAHRLLQQVRASSSPLHHYEDDEHLRCESSNTERSVNKEPRRTCSSNVLNTHETQRNNTGYEVMS